MRIDYNTKKRTDEQYTLSSVRFLLYQINPNID